ncbi:MAG: hypothetical protein V4617_03760 [Gemmatimonadota bacterium]
MSDHLPSDPRSEILSESSAARLLARASELDAARRTGVDVADLRAAAMEAGISSGSFDAALAELQRADSAPPPVVGRSGAVRWGRWAGLAAAVLFTAYVAGRTVVPSNGVPADPKPMVDETFLLRCITPGQAAALVRPVLDIPENSVKASPENSPGVLIIHATPAQMQRVRAMLDQHENSLTGVCVSGRTNG